MLMSQCKARLAIVWFSGAGILFVLIFAQTVGGRYGYQLDGAWNWLLPNVMPTLSLITSVLVMDSMGKGEQKKSINRFLFKMTFWLSIVYLLVMILTILFAPVSEQSPLEFLHISSIWLGPFQGLVTGLMGAFFIQKDKNAAADKKSIDKVSPPSP
jgi:hypothetical protein